VGRGRERVRGRSRRVVRLRVGCCG
jgi:hypothetical protein